MNPFSKFFPLVKMEEQANGSLLVYGLVTEEKPDLEKEVCDYATTKPLYELRTSERWNLTSKVAGMAPSLMAARAQHDAKQAIGAGRTIEFNDALKQIKMGFEIVDTEAIKKWKAGVFIGFSQGGEYVAKWADPDFAGCVRYTSDPLEVSSVDAPCLPSALLESMKGRTVSLAKAAGGVATEVPLQTSLVDSPLQTKFLKSKAAVKAMLASNDWTREERSTILAAAKSIGIVRSAPEQAAMQKACATISIRKGMYEVGALARMLEDLDWLCAQTEYERDLEADGSKVPDEMREGWLALIQTFKAMATEEANEMAARGGRGEKSMKITTAADFTKAAKTLSDHLDKHSEMHKAFHEKLEGTLSKDHPLVKSSQAMMDHCDKCMEAAKAAGDGEEPAAADKLAPVAGAAMSKAERDEFDALKKSNGEMVTKFDELLKRLEKTPAGGAPHTGSVDLNKSVSGTFDELLTPEPVAK